MTARSGTLTFARPGTAGRRIEGRDAGWHGVWAAFARIRQAVATRRMLAEMDDRMLADIGISRLDAQAEADRAPWDVAPRPR